MGFGIPDLTDCANQRYMAGAAGALTAVTGLDQVFVPFGAPPIVHWSLAGAATDAYCRGTIMPKIDQQLLMCAAGGALGGYIVTFLMMR